MSPFRENYYVPPPPPTNKRWAFGGIGAALLGVRLLLLCGRAASTSNDYDYTYTPPPLANYDPAALGFLLDASALHVPKTPSSYAKQFALAADGKAFFWGLDSIESQSTAAADAAPKSLVTLDDGELAAVRDSDLAVVGDSLMWVTSHFEDGKVVSMPRGGGTPKVLGGKLDALGELRSDGSSALVTASASDGSAGRALYRITPAGARTEIARWSDASPHEDLALGGSFAYFVYTSDDSGGSADWSHETIAKVAKTGGAPKDVTKLHLDEYVSRLAATSASVYFTTSPSVLSDASELFKADASGGRTSVFKPDSPDAALGDLAVDGSDVYVAYRADGAWSIRRVASGSGAPTGDLVAGLPTEPHFALSKDRLVWSTPAGLSSQAKSKPPIAETHE